MPKSKRICNKKHSPDAPRAVLIQKSSLRGHATLSSPSPSPSPSPPASPSLTPPSATTPPSDYSPPFIELKYTSKSHVHHAPCVECGARATPEWRAGPAGASTLCNACGIRWKKLRHKQKELQVKKNRATKVKGKELHTVAATIPKAEEDEEFVARSSPASEVDGNASQDMDVDLDLAVTGDPSEHSSCAEASPSASDCEMIVRGFTPPKGFDDCNSYQTLPSVIRIPSPPQVFSSQLFTVSTEVRPDGDYSVLPPLPLDLVLNNILDSQHKVFWQKAHT